MFHTLNIAVQPGPVRRIGVVDIGAHDAYIQFCTDINTCNILGLMTEPLLFNVMVYTKQEFPQILKVRDSYEEQ